MTAKLSSIKEECGSCQSQIPAGVPLYLVTLKKLIRCADCARKILPDLPQVDQSNVGPVHPPRIKPPMRMFDPKKMAAHLFDFRARRAGSE